MYLLRDDATLTPFNRKIYVLNPKHVNILKDSYLRKEYAFQEVFYDNAKEVFSNAFSTIVLSVYEKLESPETLTNMDLQVLTDFIM